MTVRGIARGAGSGPVLGGLVLPLVALAGGVVAGRLSWGEILSAKSALAWLALIGAALLLRAWAELAAGRRPAALAAAGLALGVMEALAWAATGVDATFDAGEGEEAPPARVAFVGRAGRLPTLQVLSFAQGAGGEATVLVDGREVVLPFGREVGVGPRLDLVLEEVFLAPAFVVRQGEAEAGAAMVKLRPGKRDYFQVGLLPHRFYVTVPEPIGAAAPARLRLLVQRGKLRVLEQELSLGESARVEGLSIAYGEGARWGSIRVRSRPRPWLSALGVLLLAGAALASLRGRRAA